MYHSDTFGSFKCMAVVHDTSLNSSAGFGCAYQPHQRDSCGCDFASFTRTSCIFIKLLNAPISSFPCIHKPCLICHFVSLQSCWYCSLVWKLQWVRLCKRLTFWYDGCQKHINMFHKPMASSCRHFHANSRMTSEQTY